jgi:hypothetical protein
MTAPADVLASRSWLRRDLPFPHVVARDVFKPDFYRALDRQIGDLVRLGLSESPGHGGFSRNLPGYDAYGVGLGHAGGQPTDIFLSPAWRDLLCGLHGIGPTPYVFAGAHHHAPGSKSGFIHNDFNSVWFPKAKDDEIQIPDQELCAYKTGVGPLGDEDKVEVIRGAAMIFFLGNDGWRPGNGGETGLYSSSEAVVGRPEASWPPENNTLISFECTPQSFHGYLSNVRGSRTSIIMWVHRTREEAVERYGADRFERWMV